MDNCVKNSPEIYSHEMFFCHRLTDLGTPPRPTRSMVEPVTDRRALWQPSSIRAPPKSENRVGRSERAASRNACR
jgi:hypothetical protein